MDALPDKPTTKNPENPPLEVMRYWGYSIWDPDHREPNFTSCNQYDCHPKSVVKPKVGTLFPGFKAALLLSSSTCTVRQPGHATLRRMCGYAEAAITCFFGEHGL